MRPICVSDTLRTVRAYSGKVGINKLKIINNVNALKQINKNVGVHKGCLDKRSLPHFIDESLYKFRMKINFSQMHD